MRVLRIRNKPNVGIADFGGQAHTQPEASAPHDSVAVRQTVGIELIHGRDVFAGCISQAIEVHHLLGLPLVSSCKRSVKCCDGVVVVEGDADSGPGKDKRLNLKVVST